MKMVNSIAMKHIPPDISACDTYVIPTTLMRVIATIMRVRHARIEMATLGTIAKVIAGTRLEMLMPLILIREPPRFVTTETMIAMGA